MDELTSNTYKAFNLNDIVKIEKSLDSVGSDATYGIILSTDNRGLLEFAEDEVDFADMYILSAVTDKETKSSTYKTFLTTSGMAFFEPEYEVASLLDFWYCII